MGPRASQDLRSPSLIMAPDCTLVDILVFKNTKWPTCVYMISNSNWTEWSTIQGVIARVISKSDEREARGRFEITSTITPFIKSILKSLVVSVIWLAKIGAIYSQIAPFFALNHIIFPANEEVTFQTCGLSWRFRERLRYTVELSSNQK